MTPRRDLISAIDLPFENTAAGVVSESGGHVGVLGSSAVGAPFMNWGSPGFDSRYGRFSSRPWFHVITLEDVMVEVSPLVPSEDALAPT